MGLGHLHKKRRRGFTLTEIAIVMGLVGVMSAAIFAAASSIQGKSKISQASEQLGLIATNIQTLYSSRNVTYAALTPTPPNTFAAPGQTATLVGQNVFPAEMVTSPTTVQNTWGGAVYAGLVAGGAAAGDPANPGKYPVDFVIEYQGLSPDACMALVANNSLPGRGTGLVQVAVKNSGGTALGTYNGTALPVSPSTLAGICTSAKAPFNIDWYYKLGQGCAPGSSC